MPRYFFDVKDADTYRRDEVGLDLADDEAARKHVGMLLPSVVQHSLPDGTPHAFECSARNGAGMVVYRGELLFRGVRP